MCDVDFAIFRHPNRICRWWRPISGHQLERQEIFQFRHTTQGTSVWMTHGDFQSSILHTTYDQISVTATIVVHTFSSYWEIQISSIEGNFLFKKIMKGVPAWIGRLGIREEWQIHLIPYLRSMIISVFLHISANTQVGKSVGEVGQLRCNIAT